MQTISNKSYVGVKVLRKSDISYIPTGKVLTTYDIKVLNNTFPLILWLLNQTVLFWPSKKQPAVSIYEVDWEREMQKTKQK